MSSTNLTAASYQWANRPADQRFTSLRDMFMTAVWNHQNSIERNLRMSGLKAIASKDGGLQLQTPHDGVVDFTNWSFSQLCAQIGAPARYLRTLPSKLAAENVNTGIGTLPENTAGQMYFQQNSRQALALTSTAYGRVPNHTLIQALIDLPGKWVLPPARPCKENDPMARPATEADCQGATLVKPGDMISPAGLYLSTEDMFAS